MELPDLSTVGVVMPDVAFIDKAVHDEKLDDLTREDLLSKLHEREQEIEQLVSTIADSSCCVFVEMFVTRYATKFLNVAW